MARKIDAMPAWVSGRRKELNAQSQLERRFVGRVVSGTGLYAERNHPLKLKNGRWVFLDVYMPHHGLIIELDGPEHNEIDDAHREALICERLPGVEIVRFKNREALKAAVAVAHKLAPEGWPGIAEQDEHLRQIARFG